MAMMESVEPLSPPIDDTASIVGAGAAEDSEPVQSTIEPSE